MGRELRDVMGVVIGIKFLKIRKHPRAEAVQLEKEGQGLAPRQHSYSTDKQRKRSEGEAERKWLKRWEDTERESR